jgi:Flp pilus assembly pilin Flp
MWLIATKLVSFFKDEDGSTAVGYAVMLAPIALGCMNAGTRGTNAGRTVSFVVSALQPAGRSGS